MEDLTGLPGLSTKLVVRHATGLLQAVERGRHAPPLSRPRTPRRNDALLNRLDWLRTWRKEAGAKMKVESDVVLPRDVMEAIAEANPRNLEQLAKVMPDLPWRLEHFGATDIESIETLISGHGKFWKEFLNPSPSPKPLPKEAIHENYL